MTDRGGKGTGGRIISIAAPMIVLGAVALVGIRAGSAAEPPKAEAAVAPPRAAATAATAATAAPSGVSPAAVKDLSKPAFDTTTPRYDVSGQQGRGRRSMVAEVDGHAITLADLGDAIRALPPAIAALPFQSLYPSVLEELIRRQALVIHARKEGLDEDPAIQRRMAAARDRVLADAVLHKDVGATITEKALLDRYQRDVAGRPGPEEVHIRVMVADTEDAAAALIAELAKGADFGTLARRASKDGSAGVGGDLGFVRRDGLNPEIGAVAFALRPGETAAYPVKSAGKWFVVRVEARKRAATPNFAAARTRLEEVMLREGAAEATDATLTGVTVRRYDINGQEVTAAQSEPQ